MDKKKGSWIEDILEVFNPDGFFMAGEAIKDLVVCYIVIVALLDNLIRTIELGILSESSGTFVLALGIMLVPLFYINKWFVLALEKSDKKKEINKNEL